jgi:hypothetical protein
MEGSREVNPCVMDLQGIDCFIVSVLVRKDSYEKAYTLDHSQY